MCVGPGAGLCQRPDLQDRAWTTAHMKIFLGANGYGLYLDTSKLLDKLYQNIYLVVY